jgi:hypothetical protein
VAYQDHLMPVPAARSTVESCWMCGIRLPTDRLVADGGSACPDVRWYCQDSRACTERWTSRPAGSPGRPGGGRVAAASSPGATAPRALPSWPPLGSQQLAGPGPAAR